MIDWLLEDDQPAVRYRTLTELLGRSHRDPKVRAAKVAIPRIGWAADLLAERNPVGWWDNGRSLYRPKYLSTNWKMIMLSDLGLTRQHEAVRESCELWMDGFAARGGGLGGNYGGAPHHCVAGNMARALIRFGYEDDPRVRRTLDWLVSSAAPKGGWSCFGSGRSLDSWEGLSALAAYPAAKRTPAMRACIERACEFFLQRELHRQGERYAPWYRFHYPTHYYYDILVGLDLLTSLGYSRDPRLNFGLGLLTEKQRPDRRWNLDGVHPDVEGAIAAWFREHPKQRPVPCQLETPGAPSKLITLTALLVRARVER